MSAITPHYRTISQLLNSRKFSIDEYQREYKWGRQHIEELVTDLLGKFNSSYHLGDLPSAASRYAEYFLGSVIVANRDGKNILVDGQQRVTSLTLLLIHLYRETEERDLDVSTDIRSLIYSSNFGAKSFNLDIPERLPVIRALFAGEEFTPDGTDDSIQGLVDRYDDIVGFGLAEELGDALEPFTYWLLGRVGVIEIETEGDTDAYSIFESMNDRGRPLSPVDMLKAYLLAPIESDTDRANANRAWKREISALTSWSQNPDPERDAAFVKAWLRSKYAKTTRERKAGASDKDWEKIGTTFHRWLRDHKATIGVGTESQNLRVMNTEFPFFVKAYLTIQDASVHYTPGLESIFYNANNDFTWQSTVLLAPLVVTDDPATVRKKLAATAAYLDIWVMRRAVNYIRVGYSSVSYAMWLLCKDIRNKPLDELISILVQRLDEDEVTLLGSAAKDRSGIEGLALNQFSKRYILHLLARITSFTEVGSGRADRFAEYVDRKRKNSYDIEHIWADDYSQYDSEFATEHDFNASRNRIGGLLLLPADVNRSLQAKPFAEKAPGYAGENLYAASLSEGAYVNHPQFAGFRERLGLPFTAYEHFGKEQQAERCSLVSELATVIWSPERLEDYRMA
jgi:uncharacterized protein with ParB-like and HNH nuclease domain